MEYKTNSTDITKSRSPCIVVPVFEKNRLSPLGKALDKATKGQIARILKEGDISGKVGETLLLHHPDQLAATRVLLVGFGNEKEVDGTRFCQGVEASVLVLKKLKARSALSCLLEVKVTKKSTYWKARRLIEVTEDNLYRFDRLKGKPDKSSGTGPDRMDLQLIQTKERKEVNEGIQHGTAIAKGTGVARNLGNTPGNICNPTYLAKTARQLAKNYSSVSTSILEEKDMKRLGMGALLSVSQGSQEPAKLIVMQHKGAAASKRPHVLVGKGITFDSGGISLKPGAGMHEMIYDMCGAASVMGVMTTVAELNLPINVVGVISSAENMPSGTASRPGDIVTSMSGQTIEILNTDAEGRLVLSDALTYVAKFKPESVIDIATLTGACVIALGAHATALYANDEKLAEDLLKASDTSMDKAWRMPLWDEYQKQINSNVADMANVGGREAGSVTAACFLARFCKKYKWAHLDTAGTAWKSGAQKTATGRPVKMLTQYLLDKV